MHVCVSQQLPCRKTLVPRLAALQKHFLLAARSKPLQLGNGRAWKDSPSAAAGGLAASADVRHAPGSSGMQHGGRRVFSINTAVQNAVANQAKTCLELLASGERGDFF